jgi:cytochrome c-type biogenesis protein CcmH
MKKWIGPLLTLMLLIVGVPADGEELLAFSNPAQEARYWDLIEELRCLVCQNQSLADSNASLAKDLRHEIYALMQGGAGDDEIKRFLIERYGDFVLYRPPLKTTTYLLWFGPLILLIGAMLILVFVVRGRSRQPQDGLDDQDQQQLRQLLADNPDPDKP